MPGSKHVLTFYDLRKLSQLLQILDSCQNSGTSSLHRQKCGQWSEKTFCNTPEWFFEPGTTLIPCLAAAELWVHPTTASVTLLVYFMSHKLQRDTCTCTHTVHGLSFWKSVFFIKDKVIPALSDLWNIIIPSTKDHQRCRKDFIAIPGNDSKKHEPRTTQILWMAAAELWLCSPISRQSHSTDLALCPIYCWNT